MRYLLSARVRRDRAADLLSRLEAGTFGRGFPYGDLGEVLLAGRVDGSGTARWLETCYCREYYGVAMEEELPYFEEFLTDLEVADARNPKTCKGYPACSSCDCTRHVRLDGRPFLDFLRDVVRGPAAAGADSRRTTRWRGWKGRVTDEEARRNRAG
jgi:hypothetical protein